MGKRKGGTSWFATAPAAQLKASGIKIPAEVLTELQLMATWQE